MNIKKLSRKEKEKLYIEKTIELQKLYENPYPPDWGSNSDFFDGCNDKELEEDLIYTIGEIHYEKRHLFFRKIITYAIYLVVLFVLLGITGLLLFGIRQLFG